MHYNKNTSLVSYHDQYKKGFHTEKVLQVFFSQTSHLLSGLLQLIPQSERLSGGLSRIALTQLEFAYKLFALSFPLVDDFVESLLLLLQRRRNRIRSVRIDLRIFEIVRQSLLHLLQRTDLLIRVLELLLYFSHLQCTR